VLIVKDGSFKQLPCASLRRGCRGRDGRRISDVIVDEERTHSRAVLQENKGHQIWARKWDMSLTNLRISSSRFGIPVLRKISWSCFNKLSPTGISGPPRVVMEKVKISSLLIRIHRTRWTVSESRHWLGTRDSHSQNGVDRYTDVRRRQEQPQKPSKSCITKSPTPYNTPRHGCHILTTAPER